MKLAAWCAKNPDKVPPLRRKVDVHPKKWPSLVRGEWSPRKRIMNQIARGTDYEVTANDFAGIDPRKAAEAQLRLDAEAAEAGKAQAA